MKNPFPTPWWPRLLDSPHRLCFAAAATVWIASAGAWALHLALRPGDGGVWSVVLHAQVFGLGAMPLFIAGFLFTAGPRWIAAPPLAARRLVAAVATIVAGWLPAIAGLAGTGPGRHAAAVGLLACGTGWGLLLRRLHELRAGARGERFHFDLAAASCAVTTVCLLGSAAATALAAAQAARGFALVGLWCGVAPVFVVAAHRMLPFLGHGLPASIERRWPRAPLWILLVAVWIAGAAVCRPPGASPLPDAFLAVHAAAIALLSARLWWHWRRQPATRTPLLAMLLRAFGWWTLAWCGLAAARLPGLDAPLRAALAAAALHALTLGYLGGTMLAMVTRVTATQAGRGVAIDRRAHALERLLQAATALRVAAALWPALAGPGLPAAAIAWAALALLWTIGQAAALAGPRVATRPSGR